MQRFQNQRSEEAKKLIAMIDNVEAAIQLSTITGIPMKDPEDDHRGRKRKIHTEKSAKSAIGNLLFGAVDKTSSSAATQDDKAATITAIAAGTGTGSSDGQSSSVVSLSSIRSLSKPNRKVKQVVFKSDKSGRRRSSLKQVEGLMSQCNDFLEQEGTANLYFYADKHTNEEMMQRVLDRVNKVRLK